MFDLMQSLVVATVMVAGTVLVHFWGLMALIRILGESSARRRARGSHFGQVSLILFVVFGIFALHTIEIWFYAVLYLSLGEMKALEPALYFSTVTFVALGYGDIVLSPHWRLVSAIEAANGVILIAWSTTFMLSVTSRLRMLEHDWLDKPD
ncbi:MAG: two pore domain potassium channel family protein [Hyphomonadaceae bacterium]|nr:MAG: ion transporter [Caulobacteraceae bacterium]MBT9446971.1 two pore domain potassium channel family protein [Hyphomonadaceae bacterium]TPW08146.1 MAG: ion transporter [Alphaproteobacteria bacterium]